MVAGRLSLLLALPPGYAAPLWPPAGIAVAGLLLLGGRAWPAVAVGSLLVNLAPSGGFQPVLLVLSLGAAAQALAGSWLIRRYVGWPVPLVDVRRIFLFLALGGPVSCLVNATLSVTALAATGALSWREAAFNWWTWWAGDTVGAIVFAPLVLVLTPAGFPGGWRRRAGVAVPLIILFSILVGVYVYASALEAREIQRGFDERAAALSRLLSRELGVYAEVLDSVGRFRAASEHVSRQEFQAFARRAILRLPGLRAMEWVPRVPAAERAAFERAVRAEGYPGFRIHEVDRDGRLVPAGTRPVYFPVLYIEPLTANRSVIGYDLSFEPLRRSALERAAQTHGTVASDPVHLVQRGVREPAILIFCPAESDHDGALTGFALAVVHVNSIVESWLAQPEAEGLGVELQLVDPLSRRRVAFASERVDASPRFSSTTVRHLLGRDWQVTVWSRPEDPSTRRSMQSWALLAGGMLFTGLLGAFLLAVTGQVVRTEQVVAERTDALAQLAHRTERILNSIGDGIYGTDLEGRCTFLNPLAASLTGYARDELLGRDIHEILHGAAPDRLCTADPCPLVASLVDGRVRGGDEQHFRRRNGDTFPVEFVATPLADDTGIVGGVVAFRDVTERQAVDRLKDEFISVVSHELRTPLTAIRGSMGLIAGGKAGEVAPQAQRMIDLALRNVDRLVRLINDILDLERLRSGQAPMERRPCMASDLMAQAADEVRPMALREDVGIEVEPLEVAVVADPDRIVQVLTNLLGNAVKFSPPAGTVRLSAVVEGDVRFCVRDEGRGIPPEDLERIFERFRQVDSTDAREKGGTGLGLAICQSIVEQHGGRIWAQSQVGEGSSFFFTLPFPAPGDALVE